MKAYIYFDNTRSQKYLMSLDNIVGNIIDILKKNPQLLSTVLSLFNSNNQPQQANASDYNIQQQDSYQNSYPNESQTHFTDNPYWSLPNYSTDIMNYQKQNQPKKHYQNIAMGNTYGYNNQFNNNQQSNTYQNNNMEQSNNFSQNQDNTNNQLDLPNIIKLISELLSAIKSQQNTKSQSTDNTTSIVSSNSILNMKPTNT